MYAYTSDVDEYLTLAEAAARLGLKNASGLHHAVRRGLLQTTRRGWMHFTTPAWVDEYAAHVQATRGGKGKKRGPRTKPDAQADLHLVDEPPEPPTA